MTALTTMSAPPEQWPARSVDLDGQAEHQKLCHVGRPGWPTRVTGAQGISRPETLRCRGADATNGGGERAARRRCERGEARVSWFRGTGTRGGESRMISWREKRGGLIAPDER